MDDVREHYALLKQKALSTFLSDSENSLSLLEVERDSLERGCRATHGKFLL